MSTRADKALKSQKEKYHSILRELVQEEENKTCADCLAKGILIPINSHFEGLRKIWQRQGNILARESTYMWHGNAKRRFNLFFSQNKRHYLVSVFFS